MTITATLLTSGNAGSGGFVTTSASTASVTPTASKVVVVDVMEISFNAAQAEAPSSVVGGGITFTKLAEISDVTAGYIITRWYGLTASPSAGTIVISFAHTLYAIQWIVTQLDGCVVTGTNGIDAFVQSATNKDFAGTANNLTVTLAAFGSASNGALAVQASAISGATPSTATPDTGWTELVDSGTTFASAAFSTSFEAQFKATSDTTAVATWNGTPAGLIGLASEIAIAAAAGSGGSFLVNSKRMNGGMNDMSRGL